MTKIVEKFELYGKEYTLTTGEMAKQATGSVVVSQNDTVVFVTTVVSKEKRDYDFFPLTVDFVERMYAAGKIPGGYIKRESRPSDKATLTARMIDRPIRPSFPDGFRNEVQIVAMPLVANQNDLPDIISIMGASAALMVGGVPFEGPISGVRIGRDIETGEYMVNPTFEELEHSDLELTLAGTADYISMVEAGAHEISEEDMLSAMTFGQKVIGEFCEAQKAFVAKVAPQMKKFELDEPNEALHEHVFTYYDAMSAALKDVDKQSRLEKVDALKAEVKAAAEEKELEYTDQEFAAEFKLLEKRAMRRMIIETGERVDGRAVTEIRPISVDPGYLPRVHGSALFTRGQTQALSILSLGLLNEGQRLDTIDPVHERRYIHHYNFPPYCTGEVGRLGSPKRREIGHGALAERALVPVIPDEDEFPYSIRIVSEIMESNGSSSMASTCGSTLALMDAGVPIKRPVSGIAMGLIKEEDGVEILSDIQGLEDFLGDMDFKVCGTEKGITALQMDNKAKGLTTEILGRALAQAKEGRAFILGKMLAAIPEPRAELSEYAPRIITLKIPVDKIREVIGTGGKVIRGIQDETGATIEIQEDGTIHIASTDLGGEAARDQILGIVKVPEVGEIYKGRVVSIQSFGAFVELTPSKDGLLHISRVANGRVGKVEDVLNIGDEVDVVVLDVDSNGKISLDRLNKPNAPEGSFDSSNDRGDRKPRGGSDRKPRRTH